MPIDKSNEQNFPIHTEAYYEEGASQDHKCLDKREEELIAILESNIQSAARNGSSVLTENCGDLEFIQTETTYVIQTSDGPENEMFCVSSISRLSAHRGPAETSGWARL